MKTISFKTNYNNKLSNDAFVHIDRAPVCSVRERDLNQLYEIRTKDNSHEPVIVRMPFFIRLNLGSMVCTFSLLSHGMDAFDFMEWWKKEYPIASPREADIYGQELAAYFYTKEKHG